MNREQCSECGSDETEFVQFADGGEAIVETTTEEVGNGLLELRYCTNCKAGLENVLTLGSQKAVKP